MRSLRIIALVLLLAGGGSYARADEPSPEALAAAKELLAILSPDMMKQLTGSITASFWPVVEQKARAEKIDDATIGELRAEFERIQVAFVADAMKEAPPIYARHFTADELTPIGGVLPHADRRQGVTRNPAGDGRDDRAVGAAPAGRAAADQRRLQQDPKGSWLRQVSREPIRDR
jgi:hypothetical protein